MPALVSSPFIHYDIQSRINYQIWWGGLRGVQQPQSRPDRCGGGG